MGNSSEQKILVVDDEPLARARLASMIDALPGFAVCEMAANGDAAIQASAQHSPDIVLMDIRMPGKDGLEAASVLAEIENPPAVIFCTAYDEHALEAFKANAVEYLLKPIKRDHLQQALAKAQSLNRAQLAVLSTENQTTSDILVVKTRGTEERIELDQVRALIADHKYVSVYLPGREILVDDSLKALEERFPAQFFRVHRNALVASKYIEALESDTADAGNHFLRMQGVDVKPQVSRRLLPAVRRVLRGG